MESLAGRAQFFRLNTLSINELEELNLPRIFLRGGWPELNADLDINTIHYLNDLISTFIERDIVQAAGIEKKPPLQRLSIYWPAKLGNSLTIPLLLQVWELSPQPFNRGPSSLRKIIYSKLSRPI